jgi:hypothetical protein
VLEIESELVSKVDFFSTKIEKNNLDEIMECKGGERKEQTNRKM